MRDFKIGDGVEIINYGHWIMVHEDSGMKLNFPVIKEIEHGKILDTNPGLVGRTGKIVKISGGKYAISGIPEKHAWYDKEQLKLLK
jgi:hypothetical protein